MSLFRDEDFRFPYDPYNIKNLPSNANIANHLLEKVGIKGFSQLHRGTWTFTERQMSGDTHRALLLNLEELSPCAHEKEKVIQMYTNLATTETCYQCECGAIVEPAGFIEVRK